MNGSDLGNQKADFRQYLVTLLSRPLPSYPRPGNSKTKQVVVACAYNLPSGPTMRPSAVASCLPQWMTVPMARSGPVLCEAARTMLMLSSAVVYPRPTGIMVCTAQPTAESSSVAYQPPCTLPSGL